MIARGHGCKFGFLTYFRGFAPKILFPASSHFFGIAIMVKSYFNDPMVKDKVLELHMKCHKENKALTFIYERILGIDNELTQTKRKHGPSSYSEEITILNCFVAA